MWWNGGSDVMAKGDTYTQALGSGGPDLYCSDGSNFLAAVPY